MSATNDCDNIHPLLPEYAAGALDGPDRARVDAHLTSCAACRAEADAYVDIADGLLLLAPSAEPPVGFESAVLARLDLDLPAAVAPTPRPFARRYRTLALVAAALFVFAGLGAVLGRASTGTSSGQRELALRTSTGTAVGTAVVHRGAPGWVFLTMNYADNWEVNVEMVSRDGSVTKVGSVDARSGRASFGATSPVALDDVRVIRMVDTVGRVLCHAELNT
jgi:predicted anti-sigma-YlaC factor YlaD